MGLQFGRACFYVAPFMDDYFPNTGVFKMSDLYLIEKHYDDLAMNYYSEAVCESCEDESIKERDLEFIKVGSKKSLLVCKCCKEDLCEDDGDESPGLI
jgi:hypothetical protein